MSLRVGDLLWMGDVLPSTREICSIRQGSCFNKYPAKVSHPPPTRTTTSMLCSILMKRIFSASRYLPWESLSTQNLFGHLQGGSSEICFTAASSKFPALFFPEDFDEGEGEGEGAENVSSCAISFSNCYQTRSLHAIPGCNLAMLQQTETHFSGLLMQDQTFWFK